MRIGRSGKSGVKVPASPLISVSWDFDQGCRKVHEGLVETLRDFCEREWKKTLMSFLKLIEQFNKNNLSKVLKCRR